MEYTSKLNKMFTDISLSNDLNVTFKEFLKQNSQRLDGKFLCCCEKALVITRISKVGFEMQVLTAGAWPLSQKEDAKTLDANKIQIPTEVSKNKTPCFYRMDIYGCYTVGEKCVTFRTVLRPTL